MSRRTIDPRFHVEDMLRYSLHVIQFLQGSSKSEFLRDVRTQLAVARALEVIGEAAKRLLDSPVAESMLAELPLRAIYEMRNRIIHGYDTLDLETIWEIGQADIPDLQRRLEAVLHGWPMKSAPDPTPEST